MPNIKSAKKRVKVNAVKAANNKARNTALKTAIKKANAAIDANAEDKTQAVQFACKKIDQAAAKNLLHKNTAARKKSNLVSKLNRSISADTRFLSNFRFLHLQGGRSFFVTGRGFCESRHLSAVLALDFAAKSIYNRNRFYKGVHYYEFQNDPESH